MTKLLLQLFIKDYKNSENPAVHSSVGKLAGTVGLICNILLFFGKIIVGLIAGSVSIVADAVNNFSDAASSLVTLMGFKLAQRPADKDHPYGHARYEYLSGLVVAVLVLLIGVELVKSSVGKILNPEPINISLWTIVVLVFSILIKLWMSVFYASLSKHIGSTTLRAASVDSRNDVVTTFAVLIGGLMARFFNLQIDGYVGLAVALFIIYSGYDIVKETVSPLLGKQADAELVENISHLILSHDKVLGFHDLLVHDYGPGQCFASVHAELSAEEDPLVCHDIIDDIERDALNELWVHLVIHYDPVVINDAELDQTHEMINGIIKNIDPQLSMHDFRMIRGAEQTKLVFDLSVPYSMEFNRWDLKNKIDEGIRSQDKQYNTVIVFDRKAAYKK